MGLLKAWILKIPIRDNEHFNNITFFPPFGGDAKGREGKLRSLNLLI